MKTKKQKMKKNKERKRTTKHYKTIQHILKQTGPKQRTNTGLSKQKNKTNAQPKQSKTLTQTSKSDAKQKGKKQTNTKEKNGGNTIKQEKMRPNNHMNNKTKERSK